MAEKYAGAVPIEQFGEFETYGTPYGQLREGQNEGILGDTWTDIKAGVGGLVESAAGLADMARAPFVGEDPDWTFTQTLNDAGYADWKRDIQQEYSPQRQESDAAVRQAIEDADGELGKGLAAAGAYATHPLSALGLVTQSAPGILAAGGVGAAAAKGAMALGAAKTAIPVAARVGAAVGEGAQSAGQTAGQIIQSNDEQGNGSYRNIDYAGATGAGVAATAGIAGKLGGNLEAGIFNRAARDQARGSLVRHVAGEAGEEAAQAPWETVPQNLATDQQWNEGLGENVASSALAGGLAGAGMHVITRPRIAKNEQTDLLAGDQPAGEAQPAPAPAAPAPAPAQPAEPSRSAVDQVLRENGFDANPQPAPTVNSPAPQTAIPSAAQETAPANAPVQNPAPETPAAQPPREFDENAYREVMGPAIDATDTVAPKTVASLKSIVDQQPYAAQVAGALARARSIVGSTAKQSKIINTVKNLTFGAKSMDDVLAKLKEEVAKAEGGSTRQGAIPDADMLAVAQEILTNPNATPESIAQFLNSLRSSRAASKDAAKAQPAVQPTQAPQSAQEAQPAPVETPAAQPASAPKQSQAKLENTQKPKATPEELAEARRQWDAFAQGYEAATKKKARETERVAWFQDFKSRTPGFNGSYNEVFGRGTHAIPPEPKPISGTTKTAGRTSSAQAPKAKQIEYPSDGVKETVDFPVRVNGELTFKRERLSHADAGAAREVLAIMRQQKVEGLPENDVRAIVNKHKGAKFQEGGWVDNVVERAPKKAEAIAEPESKPAKQEAEASAIPSDQPAEEAAPVEEAEPAEAIPVTRVKPKAREGKAITAQDKPAKTHKGTLTIKAIPTEASAKSAARPTEKAGDETPAAKPAAPEGALGFVRQETAPATAAQKPKKVPAVKVIAKVFDGTEKEVSEKAAAAIEELNERVKQNGGKKLSVTEVNAVAKSHGTNTKGWGDLFIDRSLDKAAHHAYQKHNQEALKTAGVTDRMAAIQADREKRVSDAASAMLSRIRAALNSGDVPAIGGPTTVSAKQGDRAGVLSALVSQLNEETEKALDKVRAAGAEGVTKDELIDEVERERGAIITAVLRQARNDPNMSDTDRGVVFDALRGVAANLPSSTRAAMARVFQEDQAGREVVARAQQRLQDEREAAESVAGLIENNGQTAGGGELASAEDADAQIGKGTSVALAGTPFEIANSGINDQAETVADERGEDAQISTKANTGADVESGEQGKRQAAKIDARVRKLIKSQKFGKTDEEIRDRLQSDPEAYEAVKAEMAAAWEDVRPEIEKYAKQKKSDDVVDFYLAMHKLGESLGLSEQDNLPRDASEPLLYEAYKSQGHEFVLADPENRGFVRTDADDALAATVMSRKVAQFAAKSNAKFETLRSPEGEAGSVFFDLVSLRNAKPEDVSGLMSPEALQRIQQTLQVMKRLGIPDSLLSRIRISDASYSSTPSPFVDAGRSGGATVIGSQAIQSAVNLSNGRTEPGSGGMRVVVQFAGTPNGPSGQLYNDRVVAHELWHALGYLTDFAPRKRLYSLPPKDEAGKQEVLILLKQSEALPDNSPLKYMMAYPMTASMDYAGRLLKAGVSPRVVLDQMKVRFYEESAADLMSYYMMSPDFREHVKTGSPKLYKFCKDIIHAFSNGQFQHGPSAVASTGSSLLRVSGSNAQGGRGNNSPRSQVVGETSPDANAAQGGRGPNALARPSGNDGRSEGLAGKRSIEERRRGSETAGSVVQRSLGNEEVPQAGNGMAGAGRDSGNLPQSNGAQGTASGSGNVGELSGKPVQQNVEQGSGQSSALAEPRSGVSVGGSSPERVRQSRVVDRLPAGLSPKAVQNRLTDAALSALPERWRGPARALADRFKTQFNDKVNRWGLGFMFTEDFVNYAKKVLPEVQNVWTAMRKATAFRNKWQTKVVDIVKPADAWEPTKRENVNKFISEATLTGVWPYYEPSAWPDLKNKDGSVRKTSRERYDEYVKNVLADPKRADAFKRLQTWWASLPDDAKSLVKDVFAHGVESMRTREQISVKSIEDAYADDIANAKSDAARAALEMERDTEIKQAKAVIPKSPGPYAPLRRFGQFVVAVRSKDFVEKEQLAEAVRKRIMELTNNQPTKAQMRPYFKVVEQLEEMQEDSDNYIVETFDTAYEAKRRAEQLEKEITGSTVQYFQREKYLNSEVPAWQKLEQVVLSAETAEENANGRADLATYRALRLAARKMYVQSLIDNHARKSELRRKRVRGFHADMLENFLEQGRSEAMFLANLQHGSEMRQALSDMRLAAKRSKDRLNASYMANEMRMRVARTLSGGSDPNGIAGKMMRATSSFLLLSNPAFYLQNATQPFMMSAPYMAGRFGNKSFKLLGSNMMKLTKHVIPNLKRMEDMKLEDLKSIMPADEYEGLVKLRDAGLADIGISQDFGEVSAAGRGKLAKAAKKWTDRLLMATRAQETMNRIGTYMTAYELAKEGGMDKDAAYQYAYDVVYRTHGDYSGQNAPRVFTTNDFTKVATQFRKFQLIQLGMMVGMANKAFRGATPAERAAARKALEWTLGTHLAAAGALGTPFAGVVMAAIGTAFGQDGEDDEETIRRLIGDKTTSDLLLRGLPAAFGLDLSNKIGASTMLDPMPFYEFKPAEGRDNFAELVVNLAGPWASLGSRAYDSFRYAAVGDYWKAMEQLAPVGVISNGMKATRFVTEGVTTRSGDVMIPDEDMGFGDFTAQLLGLQTMKQSDRSRLQSAVIRHEDAFDQRADRIRQDYRKAVKAGNRRSMMEARKAWREMNADRKTQGFRPIAESMLNKAAADQRKRERRAIGGVPTDRSNAEYLKRASER